MPLPATGYGGGVSAQVSYFPRSGALCSFSSHFLPISDSLPETYSSCFPIFLTQFPILSPPGIGRWTNPQYRQFITILEATHRNRSAENKVRPSTASAEHRPSFCLSREMYFATRHTGRLLAHCWIPSPLHKGTVRLRNFSSLPLLVEYSARIILHPPSARIA